MFNNEFAFKFFRLKPHPKKKKKSLNLIVFKFIFIKKNEQIKEKGLLKRIIFLNSI